MSLNTTQQVAQMVHNANSPTPIQPSEKSNFQFMPKFFKPSGQVGLMNISNIQNINCVSLSQSN